jgi:sortase A
MKAKRSTAWLERLLVATAIFCFGWLAGVYGYGWYFRAQQVTAFNELLDGLHGKPAPLPAAAPPPPAPAAAIAPEDRNLVGIIEVPRVGISTPVISGDDDRALDVAVGHLPDTPLPWEHGNSAIAAHRDTLFRPLEHVRAGDVVRMRTTHGDFEYRVKSTRIVEPDDVSVLSASGADALTMITCYPFRFVGHAPQRFIVRAERVGSLPDAANVRRASYRSGVDKRNAASPSVRRAASAGSPLDVPVAALRENDTARGSDGVTVKEASASKAKRQTVRNADRQRAASAPGTKQNKKPVAKTKAKTAPAKSTPQDEAPKKRRWYHILFGR